MVKVIGICGDHFTFPSKLEKLLNENWSIVYISHTHSGLIQAILKREEVTN